ncbi:myelin-oligodendrocyte glycoprotein-like isoform X2 [Antennarius striatus]|uniref:myelin-oligodendrocyte glycoprotein-like isoform X2 n=1 Tax=Antennarius striatus TaxID=241820 RepID=UPI0035AD914F
MITGPCGGLAFYALWILAPGIRAEASVSGQGQVHLIGPSLPIIAAVGDDVILPCYLEPSINVETMTVEWSKPDLKPDPFDPLSSVEYVHLYRGRREVTDMKIQSYFSRTKLFTSELKHGNISLKIINVTLSDAGRYKCFIPKLKNKVFSIVQLDVEPNITMTETPPLPTKLQTPESNNDQTIKVWRGLPSSRPALQCINRI